MDLDSPINYLLLGESINFYKKKGYIEVVTNWSVEKNIINITFKNNNYFKDTINNKIFVGSAEQGFLELIKLKKLMPGKYQSTTPCFRPELIIDNIHKYYFIKTELIYYLKNNEYEKYLDEMLKDAYSFFEKYLDKKYLKIVKKSQANSILNYDIEYKGIELGSYGYRSYQNINWIYGTGCAEQRLSYCKTI